MAETFPYDVFLSHSSKDKAIVAPSRNGCGRTGCGCGSMNGRSSLERKPSRRRSRRDWNNLACSCCACRRTRSAPNGHNWRSGTFRFRDPLNRERRFIPLRLDDAPIKGSLAKFLHIKWPADDREREYPKLLEACRPPAAHGRRSYRRPTARDSRRRSSPWATLGDLRQLPSARTESAPVRARMTRPCESGTSSPERCLRVLEGHSGSVRSVAWSADGRSLSPARKTRPCGSGTSSPETASASSKGTPAASGAWPGAADGRLALRARMTRPCGSGTSSPENASASSKGTPAPSRAWRGAATGRSLSPARLTRPCGSGTSSPEHCLRVLEGTPAPSGAWPGAATVAAPLRLVDQTVRVWDVESGECHPRPRRALRARLERGLGADGRLALSGSDDKTVRIWDVESGACLRVLEGHSGHV